MRKIRSCLLCLLLLTGCTFDLMNLTTLNNNSNTSTSKAVSSFSESSKVSTNTTLFSASSNLLSDVITSTSTSTFTSLNSSTSSSTSSYTSTSTSEKVEYVGEFLKNNDFESLDSWIIDPNSDESKLSVENHGNGSLEIKINNSKATEYWDIQVLQNNLNLEEGKTYRVRFKIKSSYDRTCKFIIQEMDYSSLAYSEDIFLSRNQVYEFDKDITVTKTSSYLYGFMLGNVNGVVRSSHTIIISNPSLSDKISEFDSYEGRKGTYTEAHQTYKNRNLIWSDEFNGNELDKNNWSYNIGDGGWGNDEYQYYTDSINNVRVVNGSLRITARKEEYRDASYTSGRIDTKNKQSFKYGYFEARISLPSMMGIWPAFWMLGDNIDEVNWPKCGEIDIMEAVNIENKVYSTLHWNNYGVSGDVYHSYNGNEGYELNDRTEYHLYGIEWKETGIKIFVDNIEIFSYSFFNSNVQETFRNEFYFLLNVAVGGNWPGFEIGDDLPQTMSVDYIRVYQ